MNTDEWFIDGHKLPDQLSKEEVYKLFEEVNKGSKEARDKLITHNIRLVLYEVANHFQNVYYDKRDLVSTGIIGLIKAINTYDLSKRIEFATYASRCIDNEIIKFLRTLKKDQNVDNIERVILHDKNGNELKLEDILSDDSDFVQDYEKKEIYSIIRELVKTLSERDKEIIMLYFGFYDDKIYFQSQIAEKIHLSQSHISRIITRIVKNLGKQLEANEVIELHTKSTVKRKAKEIEEVTDQDNKSRVLSKNLTDERKF